MKQLRVSQPVGEPEELKFQTGLSCLVELTGSKGNKPSSLTQFFTRLDHPAASGPRIRIARSLLEGITEQESKRRSTWCIAQRIRISGAIVFSQSNPSVRRTLE